MFSRNSFVPEIPVQLEDFVEAADEQPLEIKFRRDAEIKLEPERFVMRAERFRRRAARHRLQHRRLHFEKAAIFHEPARFAHDGNALFKDASRLLVRQKIEIALAITRFHILQAMPFFRKRPE